MGRPVPTFTRPGRRFSPRGPLSSSRPTMGPTNSKTCLSGNRYRLPGGRPGVPETPQLPPVSRSVESSRGQSSPSPSPSPSVSFSVDWFFLSLVPSLHLPLTVPPFCPPLLRSPFYYCECSVYPCPVLRGCSSSSRTPDQWTSDSSRFRERLDSHFRWKPLVPCNNALPKESL